MCESTEAIVFQLEKANQVGGRALAHSAASWVKVVTHKPSVAGNKAK
jgi:hypothetical protein